MPRKNDISRAASLMAAKGGKSRSDAKAIASRRNGLSHKPKYDWSLVTDWSLPSHVIAARVGCSASAVRLMRGKLRAAG